MRVLLFCFSLATAMLLGPAAMGARAIVTDPAFMPDDTWLLVKVRNDLVFAQPPVLPDYAAHLFNDDHDYTPLPSTAQFWLPKERPQFVLEFQPSGTAGDFSLHDLTTEIDAMADVVEIYNDGPGHATGQPFDFFRYESFENGSQIGNRQFITHTFSVPEPSSIAVGGLGLLSAIALSRRK